MASEVRINAGLVITEDQDRQYASRPGAFTDDLVTGVMVGPFPGTLSIPTAGRDIYFTEFEPGWCFLHNLDDTNFVEVGIFDTITSRFHPLLELPPGKGFPVKLSRNLSEQYTGSGTGTTAPESYLRLKADTAACFVQIEAFKR